MAHEVDDSLGEPAKESRYHFSADIVRTLAIAGVVLVHTANAVFGRPDFFGGISWWIAIVLNSLSRIAIPLFIMLSGYFILAKDESFTKSLERTSNRIVIPLLFWFVIYVIWNGGYPSFAGVNESLFYRLVTVNVFDLYFLIILAGLYIIAPVLRAFLRKVDDKAQRNFMIFTLLAGVVIFFSEYLFHLCSRANAFTYWLPYTGLFVAGYFLGNNAKNIKNTTSLLTIYALALVSTISFSYLYYFFHNQGNSIFDARNCLTYYSDSYLSVNVVIMAVCAFILLMRLRFQSVNPYIQKVIYSIARNSLGIYILHIFFLNILDSWLHLFDPISPAWLYLLIKWFVIFILSYLASTMLIKIPLVKRVFGVTK